MTDHILRSHSKPLSLIAEVILDRDEQMSAQSMIAHPQQSLESISAFIAYNELNSFLPPNSLLRNEAGTRRWRDNGRVLMVVQVQEVSIWERKWGLKRTHQCIYMYK